MNMKDGAIIWQLKCIIIDTLSIPVAKTVETWRLQ